MNVLFIGHDLSYAAFYSAIEVALRQHTDLQTRHLYFRPSAQLWARIGLGLRSSSPWLLRLLGRWPSQPRGVDPVDLRFHPPSQAREADTPARFLRLHAAYSQWMQRTLGKERFDVAVLPGEFRLFEQAAVQALRDLPQPPCLLYFEAGPPGYVYFDAMGVNAAASFATTGRNALVHAAGLVLPVAPIPIQTALPSALVRRCLLALDVAWLWLAQTLRGLLDLNEYWTAVQNRLLARNTVETAATALSSLLGKRLVVFIGQVRNDVNHTHFGIDEQTLHTQLAAMLSDDLAVHLIWRDHPLERSDEVLKKLQQRFPGRVERIASAPLPEVLAHCEGAVTVNSNGGLETLQAGLPLLLLGQSYFAGLTGVCLEQADFRTRREVIRAQGPDARIAADAHRFLRDCFLPINYRGEDFSQAHLAAHLILSTQS